MNAQSKQSHPFAVLVVDDEAFSRKMVVKHLTELGSGTIATASSDQEARDAMLRDPTLSLVICDHYMPGGNGLRLLWDIRAGRMPVPHDVCFVLATASKSFALAAVAIALDADSFMSKPFSRNDLARRLYASLVSGTRSIRPPDYYLGIDAPAMLAAAERADPTAPAPPRKPMKPLRNVRPDTPLVSDLVDGAGQVLLQNGTLLTRHLIARLRELGIEEVPV